MSTESRDSVVPEAGGHVFLALGRVESVGHDASVVPTDRGFGVLAYWQPLLKEDPERLRPAGWPRPFGRSADGRALWFVDVADAGEVGGERLTRRVTQLLEEISSSGLEIGRGRRKLRVAMPVLSFAGGGLGRRRGQVIATLLKGLQQAATALDLDIVLVTPVASVYSAAQHERRAVQPWPLGPAHLARAAELGRLAGDGHLALFLGAGVSVPAGLPSWTDLLHEVARRGQVGVDDLKDLTPLDQAQLLEKRLGQSLGRRVAAVAKKAQCPSLAHVLLAALDCHQVVTTNYDRLYETAVRASGRAVTSVLPWDPVEPGRPWVLKMHGDIGRPSSIVLTRRHFVRYDASTRPAGSLLQALLLTKHLLVVGASLNDDNVSRLAHEVDEFRRENGLGEPFGTYLDVDGMPAREELWGDQLRWVTFQGEDIEHRARALEVFLDAVAAHASRDTAWLLDPRFEGLLTPGARRAAEDARRLYAGARRHADSLGPLAEALERLGAGSDGQE